MLEFYSIDSENNEVHYMSEYERHGNTIVFDDKSSENTKVSLTFGHEFRIKREGKISMDFSFTEDVVTPGFYSNDMGLSVEFSIVTNEAKVHNNVIVISYDLYIQGDKISTHRIMVKLLK